MAAALPGLTFRERMGTAAFAAQRDYDTEQYNRESRALVESVRHGAWTEVALLGPGDAAEKAAERSDRFSLMARPTLPGPKEAGLRAARRIPSGGYRAADT